MPRRIIVPTEHLRRKNARRRITKLAVGVHHLEMQRNGKVTSLPPTAPRNWPRVWIPRTDPQASLMLAAQQRKVLLGSEIFPLLPKRSIGGEEAGLNDLGIVARPIGNDRFRLIGATAEIAWVANRFLWGSRRRYITREGLIERVFGLATGPRKTSVTEKRLEAALLLFEEEFGIDLSDLIDCPAVGIGQTTGPTDVW